MEKEHIKILQTGHYELMQKIDLKAFREHNRQKPKGLVDKLMTEHDAVKKYINDGDYIATELYGTVRCPMSLVREVIRQGYKNLRMAGQGVLEMDMLAAARCFTQLDWTYIGLEVYGVSQNLRRAVESGHVTKVVEWSNAAIAWRFKAAAMGIPFLPISAMLGTDTMKYSSAKVIECPFTGQSLCVVPALVLDCGLIHVNRADKYGNCQIDGVSGFAMEMARASKNLIISAEEIVDTEEIRAHPDRTIIPYYVVDAVVHAPYGSHPGEMSGMYERDEEHIKNYFGISGDEEKVKNYLNEWVYRIDNHEDYVKQVGEARLNQLRLKA
ncbi:MAG: CoA-transferase [bacterium]|nr:CoA transferase subunit A [bacterium]MBU1918704.1 CoA transferase subunit A [bacterium]